VARAAGLGDAEMARGLVERDEALRRRARQLAEAALRRQEPWVRRLGDPPAEPERRERWLTAVATVAAYRERWGVHDRDRPLGIEDTDASLEALRHRDRALAAARAAYRLAEMPRVSPQTAAAQPTAERVLQPGAAVEF
jgi:hypothetical protein